jgi:asparagine synthase (glutamine-hydrolysing)
MPGFILEIGSNRIDKDLNFYKDNLFVDHLKSNDFYIEKRTIRKFENDKILKENDDYIILIEGVILNSKKLIKKYNENDLFNTVINMYKINGEKFFEEFKGSFSGIFYDKKVDKWLIYTNHVGDKQVFYFFNKDFFIFGSEIDYIIDFMKHNKISYTFDENGAYCLLTYGYMLEDYTLFKEIKKLNAGKYIKLHNKNFQIKTYYKLDNTPNEDLKEEDIIEDIDLLFRNAVKLEFEKDIEYGYKHIASLSGGLDSRMTVWVAHEIGYNKQLNYTFSQSDYLDETISKHIARDLNHEWVFKFLDNGNYLCDIDSMIDINFGNCIYSGNAHVKNFADIFNFNDYGLLHTGQLGDVIIGTYYSTKDPNKQFKHGDGAYSNKMIKYVKNIVLSEKYVNEEIFKFYNRGFTGILQGNLPPQRYTEVISPFLDVDFLNYCLKIPLKYRYNHYIYFKWILKKYPEAAKYKWESINGKITDKKINFLGRYVTLKTLPKKIFIKLFKKSPFNSKNNMNPFGYWYKNNEELSKYFESFYNNNIKKLKFNDNLEKIVIDLYINGQVREKTQILTLLGFLKKYF